MTRHYAGSAPVEWLRKKLGINKPRALGWGEWENWDAALKEARPVAFFLTETLPEWLEKPAEWFVDPFSNLRYYINNRWVTKTHYLKTHLKPGQWYEFDTRLLHGMFGELKDFVEIEQAWISLAFMPKKKCKCAKCQEDEKRTTT